MNKVKFILALGLTLGLILVGALLPGIVTRLMDGQRLQEPSSAPMDAVELELRDGQTMNVLERLLLQSRMQNVPINQADAAMTDQQAIAVAQAQLQAYWDAGLLDHFIPDSQWAEPHLAIDPMDTNRHAIFWAVSFYTHSQPYYNIFIHLDDATGKILSINCTGAAPKTNATEYELKSMIADFQNLYFSQLGLEPEKLNSYVMTMDQGQGKNGTYYCRYEFLIREIGTMVMEFSISGGDLWVLFPTL